MKMKKITYEDVNTFCSTLSKTKGNYIIRKGFYFRTSSPEYMVKKLKEKFPDVIIIDSGEKWRFSSPRSHFWVTFRFPENL